MYRPTTKVLQVKYNEGMFIAPWRNAYAPGNLPLPGQVYQYSQFSFASAYYDRFDGFLKINYSLESSA